MEKKLYKKAMLSSTELGQNKLERES